MSCVYATHRENYNVSVHNIYTRSSAFPDSLQHHHTV